MAALPLGAQTINFSESFTGATAPGWVFSAATGDTKPFLTAATGAGGVDGNNQATGAPIDSVGNGWLRLNRNTTNQSTAALLDNQIFSVNAKIQIEMEYSFFNGTGADGITFFLIDGSVTAANFSPGAYGGSLGYANRTTGSAGAENGITGGYLGFGFDNFGNYANNTEGRNGGLNSSLDPNRISVRGPGSGQTGYDWIASSAALETLSGGGQMDFPAATTRPVDTDPVANYRSFRLTLDANNLLTVEMKFSSTGSYITAFTSDLSAYERPDTLKIGFTASTGDSTEFHEVRNITVVTTPWSTGSGAYEWDNGAGTTTWGTLAGGETNNNWYSTDTASDNKTPLRDSDVLFGNKPTNNGTNNTQQVQLGNAVEVRNMTFDTGINYVIGETNSDSNGGTNQTITFGDTTKAGLPSINVNNYNDAYARHKINSNISLVEDLAIRNFSYSTLCINGNITNGGNNITTSGYGLTNLNGPMSGSGNLIVNGSTLQGTGSGIVTISGTNTSWTGSATVNGGQLVVLNNNALGTTGVGTTVNSGGTLTFRGGISTAEPLTLTGDGTTLGRGELGGALYNDGGDNTVSGSVTLAGNTSVRSRAGNLTISGVVSGASSLTKIGDGVVTLSNTGNSYSGATIISEGALRISGGANALPGGFATTSTTGGNLQLNGGVLEIGVATDFTRRLGTANDRVQFTGDGGFSAYGNNRTVSLATTSNTTYGAVTWASTTGFLGNGNALILGSASADYNVTLTNDINFNGATREVRVIDGVSNTTGAVDGTLSGILSNGGLNKTGNGTLELTGVNTYASGTQISGGALRVTSDSNLGASNLALNGGVLEIAGDLAAGNTGEFTRSLGTGTTNVQWTGDGGFSAVGAARTVRIGNGTSTLNWGTDSSFVASGSSLIFGSTSANNTVTLANDLSLGTSGTRTIKTVQGTAAVASGVLSGVVSGAANLSVTGNGRLDLTNANSNSGALTVVGSEVRLTGSGTMLSATGVTVQSGGTFTLDNTAGDNTNRLANTAGVTLSGGTVNFLGMTGAVNSAETVGALSLAAGANTVNVARGDASGSATLTFASLSRTSGGGATVDFTNPAGTLGNIGTNPRVVFTSAPTLDDSILAYATVNGTDFATYSSVNGVSPDGISAYSGYLTTAQTNWTATTINAAPSADATLTAARTINSLKLGNGIDVAQAGFTLTLQSGGILTTGTTTAATISGGTLTTGNSNDLVVHAYNTVGTTISSTLTGTGGLTKSGTGTVTLSGSSNNTLTGNTTVNAGTLVLGKSDNVTAVAGNLVVGDGRGIDTVRLAANEQIANTSNVYLRGGEVGNAANVARLELNGAAAISDASRVETFATLDVSGNSILDFGGGTVCSPTLLYLDVLNVQSGSLLTISNWIEFTDFLLVKITNFDSSDMPRIIFDGYGGSASWKNYDSNYYQIVPYAPVPEVGSYGLVAAAGLTGFALVRRRRRA